jgi:hypothetical protein
VITTVAIKGRETQIGTLPTRSETTKTRTIESLFAQDRRLPEGDLPRQTGEHEEVEHNRDQGRKPDPRPVRERTHETTPSAKATLVVRITDVETEPVMLDSSARLSYKPEVSPTLPGQLRRALAGVTTEPRRILPSGTEENISRKRDL